MNRISKSHPRSGYLLSFAVLAAMAGSAVSGYAVGRASAARAVYAGETGLVVYTDAAQTQGVQLPPGAGSWSSVSDRAKKENFRREDPGQILDRISRLPVESWNYRTQSASVRHVGPTAQDFYASFQLGESDTTITAADLAGIGLLGVQALHRRITELEAQLQSRGVAAEPPARADIRRRP